MTAPGTTQDAISLIGRAASPADLFGDDGTRTYRRLALLVHPDANPGSAAAAEAFAKLSELWRQSQNGADLIARGDIANLYLDAGAVVKLARDPRDSDLLEREARALKRLHDVGEERYRAFVPQLVKTQRQRDPVTGAVRRANTISHLDGFCTLARVHAAYPSGIDGRDAAWMWRRLLATAGFAHRAGVVHGAVLPDHVMIHPGQHGLVLIDWCYSVTDGAGHVPAIVGRYRDWYPPEILAKKTPGPAADIWLAARCMTYLLGERIPGRMASFARGCMLPEPGRRPPDAWELLGEFNELIERMYGPRKFRPFTMPPT